MAQPKIQPTHKGRVGAAPSGDKSRVKKGPRVLFFWPFFGSVFNAVSVPLSLLVVLLCRLFPTSLGSSRRPEGGARGGVFAAGSLGGWRAVDDPLLKRGRPALHATGLCVAAHQQ